MTLTKVLQKVISVTLSAALMLWQCGFAYAVNVSDWDDLKYYTETYPADVNVTSALTADSGYPAGTLRINTNGIDITGSTLTHNSANSPLIEVNGGVTSFSVSNNLVGDVVNNGVMAYTGTLSGKVTNAGTITGTGTFNLSGASTNSGNIAQSLITQSSTSSSLANTGLIYTRLTNAGTVSGTGSLYLGGASSNSGTINQALISQMSTADTLTNTGAITAKVTNSGTIGGTGSWTLAADGSANDGIITQNNFSTNGYSFANAGSVVTNNAFSNAGGNITGAGSLGFAAGTASNSGNITQTSVTNAAAFTNTGAVNAKVINSGTINGTGTLTLADLSSNSGDITQDVVYNDYTFTNTGDVTASIVNTDAITGAGNLYLTGASDNSGVMNQTSISLATAADSLSNTGSITTQLSNSGTITGMGNITLNADSVNNGTITQNLVTVTDGADFLNHGLLMAKAHVLTGTTMASKADDLGGDVENDGTLDLDGDGTLSVNITGTGSTKISNIVDNNGTIDQTYIKVKTGSVVTTNASNFTADNSGAANTGIENEGVIKYTAGTTANHIYGTGRTDITGYVTNTGDITQDVVTNSGVFTNDGTVEANFKNTNELIGTGSITTGTGVSSNSGTFAQADLENNGTFDNTGYMDLSDKLTNYGTFTTNADLLTAANGIENESTLVFNGGTNWNNVTGTVGEVAFTGNATNYGVITQAHVANTAELTNSGVITADVYNTGKLTTLGGNIVGNVENLGTYVISDGNNANDIIGAGGTTSILGTTTNTGTIMQETLKIANSGNLTTDSTLVTATITNDGKLTWNDGATNENVVNGTGELHINGTDVVNSNTISQGAIKVVSGSLTTNADLLAAANGITNNDGLIFNGGTNTNAIDGSGDLTITNDVLNQGTIKQGNLVINNGDFTTDADLIDAAITNNDGLYFTGGANANDITGAGTTYIDGNVENTADISTEITVTTKGHYTTVTDVLADLDNYGVTDLIDANISGDITGTGTTNILGTSVNNNTIEQSALNIAAGGQLTTSSNDVTAAISNQGKLVWDAGTANANAISGNGALEINGGNIANTAAISQGNITITNGSLSTNADLLTSANGITNEDGLTFTGGTNTNVVTGTGDLNIAGNVVNNASVSQDNVNITTGNKLTTNADLIATTTGIANAGTLDITGGTNANVVTGAGTLNFTGDATNNAAITQGKVTNSANLTNNALITADIENAGTFTTDGANVAGDITNTGSYIISDGDNANDIMGSGTTSILGATTNTGTIIQDSVSVASTGLLTTDADDILASVNNEGALVWNAGTSNANAISGNGSLAILGGDINNTAAISQGSITITGGSLSTNADLLTSANGVENNAGLTFTGGTNTNAITGTGDLTTTGDVLNQSAISQNSLTVSGGQFTSDASLLTFANGVTNNSKVSLTGGTNTSTITGTGTTYIDATVTNNGTIDTNIGVGVSGHYATTNDISKALDNNGITDITNADINADITGTGTTNILGNTTNNGNVVQSALNIASNATFGTDIDAITAPITNEGSMIITGGTTNANVISGNGSLDITGGTIDNTASISQSNITITGGSLTTNADLLASANGITNDADLTFNGGKNTNAIIGTGALTIAGAVTNEADILQNDLTVSSGMFTTNADLLAVANPITNNGGLTFTGGTNINDITGTGLTYVEGTVTNAGDIATDIQINADSDLGTLTDITTTVENRGTIQLVDADVTSTGRIKGSGVVKVMGDTTNYNQIAGSTINVAAGGQLTTDSTKVEGAIVNEGKLVWNAGDANANAITGTGVLEITGGDITNTASISQDNFTITSGAFTSNADLIVSANGITNNADLTFNGGTNANAILGTGALTTTGDVINKAAITQATLTNSGNFTNDEGNITADVTNTGVFVNDDGVITGAITNSGDFQTKGTGVVGNVANTGTYKILDGDNANNISGAGTLEVFGTTTNTGVINQNDITIASGATLIASDMDDITTTAGIDNAGLLEMQAGTNTNAITNNTGALSITGAVTNASGVSVVQDNIAIATLGSLIADAGDLNTVNGITNEGALSLGDGNTANNISGNGTLAVTGTVGNSGNISQKSLNNTGTLTSNADLLAFVDGITNANVLNLTGGTNTNAISGIGTTNFTNDVINEGVIEQANVTNDTGTLTNNAAITADFANNGGTVDNEAVITGAITNTGTINSTADNLNGAVTNNNTLNLAGGTTQNVITGTGDTNITADLVNANIIAQTNLTNSANFTNSGLVTVTAFNNSGVVDNSNTITGDITNSGTINSSADHLVGDIANTGTLNISGGTSTHGDISGTGDTNITGDLSVNNTIAQTNVTNTANLSVFDTITATDIVNSGTITGKASDLVASNEIANSGSLIFNAASIGASKITGAGDVQVTADTTLTGNNTYTGTTLIDGADLTIAGQSNIGSGDVLFANNGLLVVTGAGSLDNNLLGNTATEDVLVQNDAALTLNGTIGAAADFHKSGAGAMTLAMASNAYTGDTYVDAGTLIGNTGNINNIVNGAAGTTVEFNDTTDADLNEINTLGTFVQSGSAKLNVESNAFSANVANINAGTFAANRALTANTLNVNTGARLQGNGNITGNVNVNTGATIAPGNSIDTLTITGDLNLAAGSTTAMEINETPASDKLVVTGNTNIASGAILTVSNENGRYFDWKTFDIMEAGNVAGTFTYDGTITDYDASRIDVEVDYSDPTKVTLTAKRKATDYAAGATEQDFSRNQKHVAQTIDKISTGHDGDITEGLLQLEKLGGLNPTGVTLINPDSTLKSALTDLSGVMYANASLTSLFNAKTAHVYDRIAKRNPASGECPTCHDNVWAEYYNQYDKVYADENSPRFTNNMSGALVGYDRSNEKVLLGIYGGFGKSDLRQNHDTMDIDDTTAGIYMGYMPNENWIFKGTVYGGYQSYQGRRSIDFMARKTQSHYKGWNVAVDLEGSYNIALASWLNVKPFAGVLSNYSHQQHFEEKGADSLNLYVKSKDQAHTQGRLGLQLDGKVGSRFNWYASAAVKQFFGRDYSKLDMSLSLENTDMQIISAELGRTYFSGQVGVSYGITDRLSLFGNLDTGVNNKSTNTYGNVGLAYTW